MATEESTALVTRPVTSIGQLARREFDAEQIRLIRHTVAKDCSDAELAMFLELCARYELDPFAGEVYAAKMGGNNGESGRVQTIVGRNGFLKIARRYPDFEGIESAVVHEMDTFRKVAGEPIPTHVQEGPPSQWGQIVGAWATVFVKGKRPTYVYAKLDQYLPKNERKLRFSPWSNQVDVMIRKCAIVTALREAFSITGIYDEAEMATALATHAEAQGEVDWGSDPELAGWLAALVSAANQVEPDSFRPAKVRLMLRSKGQDEREQIAAGLVEFIVSRGGDVPERKAPEPEPDEPDEEVVDAEVVGDAEQTTIDDSAA